MSKVKIVPSKKGTVVTPYESNAELGYIQLEQSTIDMGSSWARSQKKAALIKGPVAVLQEIVNQHPSLQLEGKLVVVECSENNIPEPIRKDFINPKVTLEEAIAPYVKKGGSEDDAPVLRDAEGNRILRFTMFDASGEKKDQLVAHSNSAEVSAFAAIRRAAAETNAEESAEESTADSKKATLGK